MSEPIDYEKVLADLLEERANLDRMISWVQKRLGSDEPLSVPIPLSVSGPPQGVPSRLPRLRTDAFFRMTAPEAIREFLGIVKRPQTAKDITTALQSGGFIHKSKDLYQTVFPTLLRMKGRGEVDRLDSGEWGLSEWYTGGRRAEAENGKRDSESA